MSQVQSLLTAALAAGFAALPAEATGVQALSGDRIEMLAADGTSSDILTVLLVKKKVIVTKSDVTGDKISVPVMTYDHGGIELADGSKAVLYKSPTPPKPAKKGSKKVLGAPSKLSICRDIYATAAAAGEVDKAAVCKAFQEQANCTRMGANTYFLKIVAEIAAKAAEGSAE